MNLGEAQMAGEDIIEAVDSIQLAFMEINIQLKYDKKPEIDFGNQIGSNYSPLCDGLTRV
jgi:hypothetical protein